MTHMEHKVVRPQTDPALKPTAQVGKEGGVERAELLAARAESERAQPESRQTNHRSGNTPPEQSQHRESPRADAQRADTVRQVVQELTGVGEGFREAAHRAAQSKAPATEQAAASTTAAATAQGQAPREGAAALPSAAAAMPNRESFAVRDIKAGALAGVAASAQSQGAALESRAAQADIGASAGRAPASALELRGPAAADRAAALNGAAPTATVSTTAPNPVQQSAGQMTRSADVGAAPQESPRIRSEREPLPGVSAETLRNAAAMLSDSERQALLASQTTRVLRDEDRIQLQMEAREMRRFEREHAVAEIQRESLKSELRDIRTQTREQRVANLEGGVAERAPGSTAALERTARAIPAETSPLGVVRSATEGVQRSTLEAASAAELLNRMESAARELRFRGIKTDENFWQNLADREQSRIEGDRRLRQQRETELLERGTAGGSAEKSKEDDRRERAERRSMRERIWRRFGKNAGPMTPESENVVRAADQIRAEQRRRQRRVNRIFCILLGVLIALTMLGS